MKKQQGISLSEVLVSLFLTSIIMTALVQFYMGCKGQYNETEKVLALQFDLQWVSDLLSDSVRRAGFTPCLSLDRLKIYPQTIPALQIGNQFIQVHRMEEHFAQIIRVQSPTQIRVESSLLVHENRPVLIADCMHAELNELSSIQQQTEGLLLTLKKPLIFSYNQSAYVGEYLEERWFVKKNKKGEHTLHFQSIQKEELTPLIHSLHAQKNGSFLEINLGLDKEKNYKIFVAVRGS
jgi:hypothetical protein